MEIIEKQLQDIIRWIDLKQTIMSTTVIAKMQCDEIAKKKRFNPKGPGEKFVYDAKFSVVYGGSEENDRYFDATPFGGMNLGTFNSEFFEPGKYYKITIEETELEG